VQNVTEWWAGLVFSVFFWVLARASAKTHFSAAFAVSTRPRASAEDN